MGKLFFSQPETYSHSPYKFNCRTKFLTLECSFSSWKALSLSTVQLLRYCNCFEMQMKIQFPTFNISCGFTMLWTHKTFLTVVLFTTKFCHLSAEKTKSIQANFLEFMRQTWIKLKLENIFWVVYAKDFPHGWFRIKFKVEKFHNPFSSLFIDNNNTFWIIF